MKFTYNWLLDYFEPNCSFEEILKGLLSLGLEVESVKSSVKNFHKNLEGFSVAEILESKKHENADKLNICKVNTINGIKEIVCGAPNARAGIKVIFADIGTYIPGADFTIEEKKIRGVKSCGMMLSERELCISDNHDSIIEVSTNINIGTPASKALEHLNDTVIEVSVTPNLGHLLSVRSIAKSLASLGLGKYKELDYPFVLKNIWELTSLNNKDLKYFSTYEDYKLNKESKNLSSKPFNISIKNNGICSSFIAIQLNNVNSNNLLPPHITTRLKLIEQNLVNPIVDITNYLIVDINHPMHAYDINTLGNDLVVDYGSELDSITALDNKSYNNLKDIPVIKSNNNPVAIAGIIGSSEFSISNESKNILLECAYFNPVEITKAVNKLGINTTSSYHFQRGVNPLDLLYAINKVVYLIQEYLGCEVEGVYINTNQIFKPTIINTSCSYIRKILGIETNITNIDDKENTKKLLTNNEIVNYLKKEYLEPYTEDNENINIKVPIYRYDIKCEADIAELILKLYGINNIEPKELNKINKNVEINSPITNINNHSFYEDSNLLNKNMFKLSLAIKKSLASLGLLESINMSFIPLDIAKLFNIYNPDLHLSNPISNELSVMRSSLIPSLVMSVVNNYQSGYRDVAFFEVATTYNSLTSYDVKVSSILSGLKNRKDWQKKPELYNIFDIKELMFNLLNSIGFNINTLYITDLLEDSLSYLHPHKCGKICTKYNNNEYILGYFGELHPYKALHLNLKYNPVVFELNLNMLLFCLNTLNTSLVIKSIPKLMPLERDFAFIISSSTPAIKVVNVVLDIDPLISDVKLFDVYSINNDLKSIGISVTINPMNKTLTDKEIQNLSNKIIKAVEKETGGNLREESLSTKEI